MVKDIMLDGLDKIIKRGEAMEDLQKKTVAIQSASSSIKKKSKKLNNRGFWSYLGCMGCNSANDDTSRGISMPSALRRNK